MDRKIIKGLISEKLEVIQEQFSIIKEYEGKIPVIEIDLLMASIRDLYELTISLQAENLVGVIPKPVPAPEGPKAPPPPDPPVIQNPPEDEQPVPEPVTAKVRLSSGIISMERVIEEKPEIEVPAATIIPAAIEPKAPEAPPEPARVVETEFRQEPEPAPSYEPEPEPQPIAESFPVEDRPQRITFDLFTENSGSTLADRLMEGQEKRIADKFQENKVTDLRSTIGINDKFLFINELFEGNMRIYDEAVQKLNASLTIAQTDLLLLDLKIVYNWDSESPTVKKFVELVRRKF
jgi:hypothetical protein